MYHDSIRRTFDIPVLHKTPHTSRSTWQLLPTRLCAYSSGRMSMIQTPLHLRMEGRFFVQCFRQLMEIHIFENARLRAACLFSWMCVILLFCRSCTGLIGGRSQSTKRFRIFCLQAKAVESLLRLRNASRLMTVVKSKRAGNSKQE